MKKVPLEKGHALPPEYVFKVPVENSVSYKKPDHVIVEENIGKASMLEIAKMCEPSSEPVNIKTKEVALIDANFTDESYLIIDIYPSPYLAKVPNEKYPLLREKIWIAPDNWQVNAEKIVSNRINKVIYKEKPLAVYRSGAITY